MINTYGKAYTYNMYIHNSITTLLVCIPEGHSKNDKLILLTCELTVTGTLFASDFCTSLGSFKAM